jgi:PKD repeat protein
MAFDSVAWVFGDGKRSRDPAIEHAYAKPGTYVVTLRIGRKGPDVSEGSFRVIVK